MTTQILYTTSGWASGGRTGRAESDDGRIKTELHTPAELGGSGGPGTNPEQLFACAYAACFLGAIKFVAATSKIEVSDATKVTATVGVGPRSDGEGFGLSVTIAASLPGLAKSVANDLVRKAHIVCPYSDFARGNVTVDVAAV